MASFYVSSVSNKMASFEARRQEIARNRDLSEEGKDRQFRALDAEIAAYQTQALSYLDSAWAGIRKEYQKVLAARAKAEEAEAARWNFERLNYARESVRAAIQRADDFTEFQSLYDQAKESGDQHARRAMLEFGPVYARERFSGYNLETGRVEKDSRRLLDQLKTTPDIKAALDMGHQVTSSAVEAERVTKAAAALYDRPGDRAWGYQNDFSKLMNGVHIKEVVDIPTLGLSHNLVIDGESEAAGQVAEGAAPAAG